LSCFVLFYFEWHAELPLSQVNEDLPATRADEHDYEDTEEQYGGQGDDADQAAFEEQE